MKKFYAFLLALAALSACREWDPVLTFGYPEPPAREPMMAPVNMTIAGLKQLYLDAGGKPVEIKEPLVIGAQVISSDREGNVYRDMYIQDDTGAICLKVGKSSLYSDYHPGQWVYVDCAGLVIGSYSGMPQLGIEDDSGSGYDAAYLDAQYLIDKHIFRGRADAMPAPYVVSEGELAQALKDGYKNDLWGKYVTLKGMTYGAKTDYSTDHYKRIFAILYAGDSSADRVFLSDRTYGVTSWAMSKSNVSQKIFAGNFDGTKTQDGRVVENEVLSALIENAAPVTMSQYFSLGSVPVQIRTSGYAKFADSEIPAAVLGDPEASSADGVPVDVTGILTIYNGAAQFTLIDLDGFRLSDK